jgi:hypothetical protein
VRALERQVCEEGRHRRRHRIFFSRRGFFLTGAVIWRHLIPRTPPAEVTCLQTVRPPARSLNWALSRARLEAGPDRPCRRGRRGTVPIPR